MDWCFHCDHPCARCPVCYVNDCACGCVENNGDCPAKDWWESQKGHEWRLAGQMYWRPSRDELVAYIKALEKSIADKDVGLCLVHTPLKVLEYARWHGVKVGFHMEGDDWRIWLVEEPEGEPRQHVKSREKAEKELAWEKERANRE
jgi:hypothetical protein